MITESFFYLKADRARATGYQKLNAIFFKELLVCGIRKEELVCWKRCIFSNEVAKISNFVVDLQHAAGLLGCALRVLMFAAIVRFAYYFDFPHSLKAFT